jgi:outer membrane lipoprotein LolB
MTSFGRLVAAASITLLSACAMLAPSDRPAQRAAAFDLIGRVAVTFDGRNFSSGLRWQHVAERDEVWLMTPTGQALAHILADDNGAKLTGADQQTYQARDVEALTRRALGWELPLARLAWWVRGEPVPGSEPKDAVRDEHGRLVRFAQDGWNITLTHPPAAERRMPQRLELAREGHKIRLVIDSWRDAEAAAPGRRVASVP